MEGYIGEWGERSESDYTLKSRGSMEPQSY